MRKQNEDRKMDREREKERDGERPHIFSARP